MTRCRHPTIIKFYGYSLQDFKRKNNITIFMELAKKGSLSDYLQKVQKGLSENIYTNTNRQIILIGITRGMMYLHRNRILHRDLKPGNILLDDNLYPYITDFGLSKWIEAGHSYSQSRQYGTYVYMSPETLKSKKYNWRADVYSFGILMYEVVTDLTPFPLFQSGKMTPYQFSAKVINENYRPKFKFPIKESIQKLIERCWSDSPDERPTFEDIFKKLANISPPENDQENYFLDDVDADEIGYYVNQIYKPVKLTVNEENENMTLQYMKYNTMHLTVALH